jgi:hypothetical protein
MDDDVILTTSLSATNIVINWPATTNRFYRVLYRENLSEEGWQPLAAPVSFTNGMATALDLLRTQRFYRLEVRHD